MARGAKARLFVAVDPPADVRHELVAWARALAAGPDALGPARVLHAEALHLTLCFLGGRPVTEIEVLGGALAACAVDVGELRVGAPLLLPPRRPRALAVEIHDPEGSLAELHRRVCARLSDVSAWEPERRRLRPHVTVARLRSGSWRPPPGGMLAATPPLAFTVRSLCLYRSFLEPAGAHYEPLARCELGVAG